MIKKLIWEWSQDVLFKNLHMPLSLLEKKEKEIVDGLDTSKSVQ